LTGYTRGQSVMSEKGENKKSSNTGNRGLRGRLILKTKGIH
jgi:hypothetical protein